jgi:dTDP-4-amino-4,6-dideoxygalactose transaminase
MTMREDAARLELRTRREDFIVFGAPLIEEEEIAEVVDTLRSGWLSTGPKTKRFERDLCEYVGAPHALGTNSCTAAMHLALVAAGIGPGDEVIVPAMTFAATANVVEHTGARPVFADVGRRSFHLDPEAVERRITPRTKALIPVHFAGLPAPMDAIMDLARRHGLVVIEDAAHAIGSEYRGRRIGSIGDFTCFSFYVTKNLATAEGGMVTSRDGEAIDRMRVMSLHGMDLGAWQRYSKRGNRHYQVVCPGFKYNMTDLAASLGIHQLRKLDGFIEVRRRYAERYGEAFADIDALIRPPDDPVHRNAWHLYPLMVRPEMLTGDRDDVVEAITEENIGVGIHFRALHLMEYYRRTYGYSEGDCPRAEFISDRVFSLPLSPRLTEEEVDYIIETVRDVMRRFRR